MSERVLKIGFVGAGAINFGRAHLPWDHASRLEQLGGVDVIGIVDLDEKLASSILEKRQASKYGHYYKNCKIFKNYRSLIELRPDAVLIGIPPAYRGSFAEEKDLELQFARAGIHVFVEKPLSVLPPEEFMTYAKAVTDTAKEKNVIVSVGYMFRYSSVLYFQSTNTVMILTIYKFTCNHVLFTNWLYKLSIPDTMLVY